MLGHHRRVNAASHIEFSDQAHESRRCGGNQIGEYLVGHRFVERAAIAEGPNVELQRFQFHAALIGDIFEFQRGEVGLSRFRAQAGELRNGHPDRVVALGRGVGKDFEGVAHRARGLRLCRLLYTTRHIDGHAPDGRAVVPSRPVTLQG
jgi:hypothetical protein